MRFKAMKSYAEQLRKHQEQDFLRQPVFIGGETLSQRSLRTLLPPAMHHNTAQTTEFTYARFSDTFQQQLCTETPDSITN